MLEHCKREYSVERTILEREYFTHPTYIRGIVSRNLEIDYVVKVYLATASTTVQDQARMMFLNKGHRIGIISVARGALHVCNVESFAKIWGQEIKTPILKTVPHVFSQKRRNAPQL